MSTASIPPAHDARALYVFCVARAGVALPDGDGLDAAGSLHTVASAGLAALVCEVALADFTGPGGEANLGDLAWLGPRALRHEAVIEAAMGRTAVLPLRFGCLFSAASAVERWLARDAVAITTFLERAAGHAEWSLRGWIDVGACERALAASDPRRAALPSSPGARYLAEQRLRRDIAAGVAPWTREVEAALLTALGAAARRLPARGDAMFERRERQAFHLAVLAAPAEVAALQARSEAVVARWPDHGLALEWTGPWPPYNFTPPLGEVDAGG